MSVRRFDDLARRAEAALPEDVARYFRQGADASITTAEAVAAWDRIRLLPHCLTDVADIDTRTTLLGTPLRLPIGVAPTSLQRAAHADGELAAARAVAAHGGLLVVSSNAGTPFADIGATGVSWWLQAYLSADRQAVLPMLQRGVAAGAQAIVLTVDTPVVAAKDNDGAPSIWDTVNPALSRVNFDSGYGREPGHEKAVDLGPGDIGWLREATGLPVVVKGVLRPDDARRCVDAGAAAIWVSNHGGRQLDGAAATADCLSAIVDTVDLEVEVYVDGGLRSGRHAMIALALGARAVFVGRPILWALAAGGEAQIAEEFDVLETELVEAMRLAGMRSPGADRSLIATPV